MIHKLSTLLKAITPLEVIGETDKNVVSLESDSRTITRDGVFVALRGTNTDGHKYIPVVGGAHVGAIVCEELPTTLAQGTTYIRVADTADALGRLASAWYGNPSAALTLVGVTGTNGKTTTATLLYEMARLMGHKAGLFSTVCNYIDGTAYPTTHTTPDPLTINRLMSDMVAAGCTYAFMEVSSHAADQKRIAGLTFAGGVFSNLTRDHLDYHRTVENYMNAKKKFFDSLPKTAFALVNADDKAGSYMVQNTRARMYTYSLRGDADFRCRILEKRLDGSLLSLDGTEVETPFVGRFNAYNLTAVYGASLLCGWQRDDVLREMSRLVPVAGRFQTIHSPAGITAIVDYAHTPDALVNVLDTIREAAGPDARIITVTGAGGDRDHGKRPLMASEAAHRSDVLILTSDNPRTENPSDIIADMRAGLDAEALGRTRCIPDRRQAIREAIRRADRGDVILIAGKGHETYQEIDGVRHHFDDREEVRAAFSEQ